MASAVAGIGHAICVGMVVTQRHLDVFEGISEQPILFTLPGACIQVTSAEVIKCKVELLQSILLIVTCSQRRSMASVSPLCVQLGKHLLTINRKSHKARFGSFIIVILQFDNRILIGGWLFLICRTAKVDVICFVICNIICTHIDARLIQENIGHTLFSRCSRAEEHILFCLILFFPLDTPILRRVKSEWSAQFTLIIIELHCVVIVQRGAAMFITHSDDNVTICVNSVHIAVEIPRKGVRPMRIQGRTAKTILLVGRNRRVQSGCNLVPASSLIEPAHKGVACAGGLRQLGCHGLLNGITAVFEATAVGIIGDGLLIRSHCLLLIELLADVGRDLAVTIHIRVEFVIRRNAFLIPKFPQVDCRDIVVLCNLLDHFRLFRNIILLIIGNNCDNLSIRIGFLHALQRSRVGARCIRIGLRPIDSLRIVCIGIKRTDRAVRVAAAIVQDHIRRAIIVKLVDSILACHRSSFRTDGASTPCLINALCRAKAGDDVTPVIALKSHLFASSIIIIQSITAGDFVLDRRNAVAHHGDSFLVEQRV